ncbi:sigma-54-dependent transcriptional regulator [Actibacterium sp. XHP0104]|uniref:sigma-54-dependent transcriptional regulator n=1 Tax=Actibacterium sp. XHP0104 TaxID=2984335 RepID=UPI0021E8D0FE|nr:sigma-54 dependent transcriptional regulator [Actibacterium sp. XHP0104]MCV2882915.1 sigma-54 dependent transcriptional regulator [Actibacterium sp. XHP0104]
MSGTPLLLIEDTPSLQMVYESVLTGAGHSVVVAGTAAEGLDQFTRHRPDVVLLDLMLPDRSGLDLMRDLLTLRPDTNVIVVTANGSINRAVEAMRGGAYEFLLKPFNEQRFLHAIDNALSDARRLRGDRPKAAAPGPMAGFVGSSPAMQRVYERIQSVSRSMATVFITGESGTGKEICAQAVHASSNRANGPFVPLNCGAIPSDLLESEVFGHLRGSFTGAIADKPGAAQAADGGTLFLDEICEMDLNLQTKLLRFLQTSMIQPVGAPTPRKVNVRIICATNRDPLEEVRRGRFREDLYYRLHVVPVHLPPLRERGADVIEISQDALERFASEEGRVFTGLDPRVRDLFLGLPWPGNVRQLLNVLRHGVVLNDGPLLTLDMLPIELLHERERLTNPAPAAPSVAPAPRPHVTLDGLLGKTLAEIEQLVIEETIALHGGSVPKAARVLDVSPSTLYRKRETWTKDQS